MNLVEFIDQFDDTEKETLVKVWNALHKTPIHLGTLPFVDYEVLIHVLNTVKENEENLYTRVRISLPEVELYRNKHKRNAKAIRYLLVKLLRLSGDWYKTHLTVAEYNRCVSKFNERIDNEPSRHQNE